MAGRNGPRCLQSFQLAVSAPPNVDWPWKSLNPLVPEGSAEGSRVLVEIRKFCIAKDNFFSPWGDELIVISVT